MVASRLPLHAVILADFAAPTGGAQKVAIESARALAEEGARVTYVHAVGTEGDAALDHPRITRVGFGFPDVWDRSPAQGARLGIWHAAAARRLAAVLAALPPGPTVLHLHQWTRSFSPSVLPVLLRSGHPLAITLHDYFLLCPNGVYYRFDKEEPCTLAPLGARCLAAPCDPRSSLHKAVRVLRTLAGLAALVGDPAIDLVHVSDRARDTLAPFGLTTWRHHRLDNPVSVARAAPAAIGPGSRIAYLGRLTREKGADLVAAAAHRAGMPALFVGEGPLAADLPRLHPDAEVLGWRAPEAVAALLRTEVRAVAAPSRWYETGPLTIYEALAAGVPAVASDRSGAGEKVRHGETGFVVPPTVDALTNVFAAFADDARAREMGLAAYDAFWADPPTPAAHARGLLAIYDRMLSRWRVTAHGRAPALASS